MEFTYEDLQKMRLDAWINNGILTFNDSTQGIQFLTLTDKEELKEVRFETPQPNLRYLDFGRCNIEKIVFSADCENLQAVYLQRNQLTHFEIKAKLPALELLDLSFNKNLAELKINSDLPMLKYLYLHKCDLRDLSALSGYFTKPGFDFNIEENENLQTPPPEIVKQGKEAVVNYFSQILTQGVEKLYEGKVLFVGEPGAGKTTMMKIMTIPGFKLSGNQSSTVGVEVEFGWKFPIDKTQNFVANLWDFGGQDIQFMFHQFFLTSGALYLLLTDNRKQNTHFNYWFNIIKLLGNESKVIVVKNEHKGQKITNFDEALYRKNFPEIDFVGFDVDLNNKKDGRLDALLKLIQSNLLNLRHIGNNIPASWPKVRNEIIKRKEENYLTWDQFGEICLKFSITNDEDKHLLLSYLHIVGLVLYYHEDEYLSDTIFINPNWVFEAVYSVLKQDKIRRNNGQFERKWIEDGWKKYTVPERNKLFRLLLKDKFDVCYQIDSDGKFYMVPLLLPNQSQTPSWEFERRIRYRLDYDFLPYGLLSRLIVRLKDYVDRTILWKNGVLFRYKEAKALVTFNELTKRFIEIELEGPLEKRKRLLDTILLGIENIHERSFKNIRYTERVQCVCSVCVEDSEPHLFSVKTLITWINAGIIDARCEKSAEEIPIQNMLDVVFNIDQIQRRMAEKIDSERKSPTHIENFNQYIQQQNDTRKSKQVMNIGDKHTKEKKKKSFWKRTWVIISAVLAFLASLAAIFGKDLSDFFGF